MQVEWQTVKSLFAQCRPCLPGVDPVCPDRLFEIFTIITVVLALLCLVDYSILIKWTSPFPILGKSGVHFHFYKNSCEQTV